jgi:hypothetical protein
MNDDRIYLELRLTKSIETDDNGNVIFEAEASNEELDFDEQVVLKQALLDSKEYFLANGVISYDHRHLRPDASDPHWTPEKYIIGEPIAVFSKGDRTFVRGKLYKSNETARELIGKLKDGATIIKTSVGGKMPQVIKQWSNKAGKVVEQVVSVLWDELALTFKPVNQTLTPAALSSSQFVKSLQAGFGTDSANMTGGRAMIYQDLQRKHKPDLDAVVTGLAYKDFRGLDEVKQFLKNRGCSDDNTDRILRSIIENKDQIKEDVQMDANLMKSFEESTANLEKALNEDQDLKRPGKEGFPPKQALSAEGDDEDDEYDEDDEDLDEDGNAIVKKGKGRVTKSFYDEIEADAGDFLEVSSFLDTLVKSLSKKMGTMQKQLDGMYAMQKSIGSSMLSTAQMVKSIGDGPAPRQSQINRQTRTFVGSEGKAETLTRNEILSKAQKLVEDGKMTLNDAGIIEDRLNKSQPIDDATMRLIKSM